MKDYQEVRRQLIGMLEELDERLDKITADFRHGDKPLEQDFAEQATETENDEVLDSLGNSARDEAEQIRHAILRIDTGTYGICSHCGAVIDPERLDAMLYANLCIDCARHREDRAD